MKISVIASATTLTLAVSMAAAPILAQPHSDHGHGQTKTAVAAKNDLTEGVVRRIDAATGRITIRHGEIKRLDMPPMTMVFTAAEPALLSNLKVGDKIRFVVDQQQGKMIVTHIVPSP